MGEPGTGSGADLGAAGGAARGPAVIAVTADDDRYADIRRRAMDVAANEHARLILYDWDAATVLGDPLPSAWSADGTDDAVPSELDASDLEAAGREPLIRQLREAEEKGIRTTAWLPSSPGPEALATYAREHHATTIVVAHELHASGELERLVTAASDPVDALRQDAPARLIVVPGPPRP
jgi:nucleotide-binding universal stress UspA family protein